MFNLCSRVRKYSSRQCHHVYSCPDLFYQVLKQQKRDSNYLPVNVCLKRWLCFHSASISFPLLFFFFKGHSLWGPGQESRNVQSSSYSWNYVQVSIIIFLSLSQSLSLSLFFFTAWSILQIQAKSNSLPFNKFWHSWCDAAIHAVLWSSSSHRHTERERERASCCHFQLWYAVIQLWYEYEYDSESELTVFLSEGKLNV